MQRLRRMASTILGVTTLSLVVVAVGPRLEGASGALSVVRLTSTLDVATGDAIRDTHFIWEGPADTPILRLDGTQFATLEHLVIEVAPGFDAGTAIEMNDHPPNGGPFNNHLRDIRIGKFGEPGRFDYGLRWNGVANGDSNTITNVTVIGAAVASVSLWDTQATTTTLRSVFSFDAPIGLQSRAGGMVQCENCGFTRSTDADVHLLEGGGMLLTGVTSKGSRAFAHITGGSGGNSLSVFGGTWESSSAASGPTITGVNPGGYRMYLRLTDFAVTPLGATPLGSITGYSPTQLFLSNVVGIS